MTTTLYVQARLKCRGGCGFRLVPQNTPDPIPDGHRRNRGRDLCGDDYDRHYRAGDLDDFPRATLAADFVLDVWDERRQLGDTREEVARYLGMRLGAFERALFRARVAGDRRAVMGARRRYVRVLA